MRTTIHSSCSSLCRFHIHLLPLCSQLLYLFCHNKNKHHFLQGKGTKLSNRGHKKEEKTTENFPTNNFAFFSLYIYQLSLVTRVSLFNVLPARHFLLDFLCLVRSPKNAMTKGLVLSLICSSHINFTASTSKSQQDIVHQSYR